MGAWSQRVPADRAASAPARGCWLTGYADRAGLIDTVAARFWRRTGRTDGISSGVAVPPCGRVAWRSIGENFARLLHARDAIVDLARYRWTAIAAAAHDHDADQEALVEALRSPAAYVGVLGSQRRLPERLSALKAAGLGNDMVARLRAPIGLPIGGRSPWEVAIAVAAEIIALTTRGDASNAGEQRFAVAAWAVDG